MNESINSNNFSDNYFPPSEEKGGWRKLSEASDIRDKCGMKADKIDDFCNWVLANVASEQNAGIIIRHGYVVGEWANETTERGTLVEIKSAAKALLILAVGLAIDDARNGKSKAGGDVAPLDYDRRAYDYIPDGHPLSDPRKADITVRQLMHHVSGVLPECTGVTNFPPEGVGFWEFVLGMEPDFPTSRLYAEPGTKFLYGTYDMRHLCLILKTATGMEIDEFLRERIFEPCGIHQWRMERQGGDGFVGPYADFRIWMTQQDFARVGYLMLRGGKWDGKRVIPEWLMEETFRNAYPDIFQEGSMTYHWCHKPEQMPNCVPHDIYYTAGAGINFCLVAPGLDLVVVRVGNTFDADWSQVFRDMFVRIFDCVEGNAPVPGDMTRPVVKVVWPCDGESVSGVVEIEGEAADDDEVGGVYVSIDNCGEQLRADGTEKWRFEWDTREAADGEHKVFVRAFDAAGNASVIDEPLVVKVDNGDDGSGVNLIG